MRHRFVAPAILFLSLGGAAAWLWQSTTLGAQSSSKVDFARDVQPIFQQNCIGCHGPTQQMNGFRLDRRRDAMRGGTLAVIGPGNSAGSRLYLRLTGTQFGPQMPPTGALRHEQVELIKNWIDQGAEWPDHLAGDGPVLPPDPGATRLIDTIRGGKTASFARALEADAAAVNKRGVGGSTPLMWAALDGDIGVVRLLLDRGADPKMANDNGVTPLIWAIPDLEKVRILLARGADPNATTANARTPLSVAAAIYGASDVVKLLLDRGAEATRVSPGLFGPVTALTEAAYAGDETTFRLLLERGSDPAAAGPFALHFAQRAGCTSCVDALLKVAPPPFVSIAAALSGPPLSDARGMTFFLDRGADPNTRDLEGRTLLMLAASSDRLALEAVHALIAKGADVNATSPKGETAIALAALRGQTPVLDALVKAGAKAAGSPSLAAVKPQPAGSPRAAIERSLPLLQRSDVTFLRKSGCVSCHNNTLTAMTVALARQRKIAVDETIAREQKAKIGTFLESWRERVLEGVGIPGDADTISYILLGLAAENYPQDAATDAMARFLVNRQAADGRWMLLAHRPPIESSEIEVTAASIRALQTYAPARHQALYDRAIQRAAEWLNRAEPSTTEERAFHLLGLKWTGRRADAIAAAGRALVAQQRPDGGWAQIPSLSSDAYATGQALVALIQSGAIGVGDPAYVRGSQFLMSQQLADGSWYVSTRAIPIQPHFEADFPHGRDQFISAAATNWAAMALSYTVAGTSH